MKIYFAEEEQVSADIIATMEKAATRCVTEEGLDESVCEVSVSFVSADEIHALNKEYRDVDKVTDVLSFPQYESVEDMPDELIELGDVVICRDQAMAQAEEFGHPFEREIIYLFVHSILHLLGYDHITDEDKKEMRAREEEVMEYLGIGR